MPVDYSALAKQAGAISSKPAAVDYSALAKQAGATSSTPAQSSVAPGTSDDDLIKNFGYDPAVIKSSAKYQEAVKHTGSGVSFVLNNPTEHPHLQAWRNAPGVAQVGDVGMGANDVLNGVLQLARHGAGKLGMLSDADVQYGDLLDRVRNQDYLKNVRQGNASGALRMLGNVLMPIPGGPEMKAGEGLVKTVAKGAVQGAKVAAAQPVEGAPGDFGREKATQIGSGAAVGAAIPAVMTGATKAYNAAAGHIPEDAKSLMEAAKNAKVRLLPGDITQNPVQQKAEVLLESVPGLGTGGERAAQQTEAKAAAQNLGRKYYEKFLDTDAEHFKDVTEAGANGDQRAKNLLDKIQNAGNDPDKNLQASIGLADFRSRSVAGQLYDKVQELAERHNLGDVPLNSTQKAIDRSLLELKASKIKQPELIGLLQEIRSNVAPKRVPVPEPTVKTIDAYSKWKEAQAAAENLTDNGYQAIRNLRSDLGDRIRSYYQGNNAIIGEKGVGHLERVQNAIEDDLRRYAQQSGVPEIQQAGEAADKFYKSARVPFKDGMLAQAAVSTEPDQIYQQFIKAGKGDRAQKFYDALDDRGRAAVRYSMIADAANGATDPAKGIFSPQKFFSSLNKIDDAYGVFFRGPEKREIDGFQNLMAHVTRAGQFAENPPTGNRLVPLAWAALAGTAAHFNAPAAAGTGAILAIAKPLMMSDAGKRFLLASSMLKPGSPAMQRLYERALNSLSEAGAKTVSARPNE